MTVGETLKRARKKMNMNLDEVAAVTKIAKMFLIALENDDVDALPKGVYARNFLRTYAKFLNLDEDIITAEYHEQFHVVPHFVAQQEQTKIDDMNFKRQKIRSTLIVMSLIAVVALVLWFLWRIKLDQGLALRPQAQPESSTVQNQPPPKPEITTPDPEPQEEKQEQAPAVITDIEEDPEESATQETETPPQDAAPEPVASDDAASDGVEPLASEAAALDEESEEPVIELPGEAATLPISSLEGIAWTQNDRPAEAMDEMFALEALATVWVRVTIDGVLVTERNLARGDTRYYRYGEFNTIVIGDTSKVAIQEGGAFREQANERNLTINLSGFGKGELIRVLDERIAALDTTEE